jgi:two-component system, NarL family, sensor histidine kinase DesK
MMDAVRADDRVSADGWAAGDRADDRVSADGWAVGDRAAAEPGPTGRGPAGRVSPRRASRIRPSAAGMPPAVAAAVAEVEQREARRIAQWRKRNRYRAMIFLLVLAFPTEALLTSDVSTVRAVVQLALAAAATGAYLRLLWTAVEDRAAGRTRWELVIGMTVLVAALLTLDATGWQAMLYFLVVGWILGVGVQGAWAIGPIAGSGALAMAIQGASSGSVLSAGIGVASVGVMMLAFYRLRQTNEELQWARVQVAQLAVADERARFARDLHDLLGHSLSVIAVKSELASRLLPAHPERAASEVADIEAVAREALVEVRDAVTGYRRPTLASELATAETALEAAGIAAEIDITADPISEETEPVLAWALREAVTNVIRHSAAKRCWVRVVPRRLEVLDDGVGPGGPHGRAGNGTGSGRTGNGLGNGVASVGGELQTGRRPDGGYRLAVTLPVLPAS